MLRQLLLFIRMKNKQAQMRGSDSGMHPGGREARDADKSTWCMPSTLRAPHPCLSMPGGFRMSSLSTALTASLKE